MFSIDHIQQYIRNQCHQFIDELSSFISIPSVSAERKYNRSIKQCAVWLQSHLQHIGMKAVSLIETDGHPIVYAEWMEAPGKPTLLIYGHYDVQPADSALAWSNPPFSPSLLNGYIYGRGASDDKGQLFVHIKALEYYLRVYGKLPLNVRCVFEGEEETGSKHLLALLQQRPGLFKADVVIVSDMMMPHEGQPAITYSMRGALAVEIFLKGQLNELHSGIFGGAICNPLQALCEIITALHKNERIAIPGFYDKVNERSNQERNYMYMHGRKPQEILTDAGTKYSWGEQGFTLNERICIRPSLSVNGIKGGYQDEGSKAIIPAVAAAKLSFRLVPDQHPDEIFIQLKQYVENICPKQLQCTVSKYALAKPVFIDVKNIFVVTAAKACKEVYGKEVVYIASGGTIPIVAAIREKCKVPVVLLGFALPGDNLHGANERFNLDNFEAAIKTSATYMHLLGNLKPV